MLRPRQRRRRQRVLSSDTIPVVHTIELLDWMAGGPPPAVLATADRETKGATVLGYASEVEAGKTQYEVETKINGHTRDLAIARDGSLIEVEEEVAMESLPPAVPSP